MTLYEKIIKLYPELDVNDFVPGGTITLQNDSDGKGDYIAAWNNTKFKRPTDEQLAGVK